MDSIKYLTVNNRLTDTQGTLSVTSHTHNNWRCNLTISQAPCGSREQGNWREFGVGILQLLETLLNVTIAWLLNSWKLLGAQDCITITNRKLIVDQISKIAIYLTIKLRNSWWFVMMTCTDLRWASGLCCWWAPPPPARLSPAPWGRPQLPWAAASHNYSSLRPGQSDDHMDCVITSFCLLCNQACNSPKTIAK